MATNEEPLTLGAALRESRALRMLGLAFGWSYAVALVLYGLGDLTPLRHVIGGFIYMLGPALAALVVVRRLPKAERMAALGLARPRKDVWLLLAWLVPLVLLGLSTLGVAFVAGAELRSPAQGLMFELAQRAPAEQTAKLAKLSPSLLSALLIFQACFMGAAINTPLMLSEELGWRGLLWTAWRGLGFTRQALLTGVVWGLWHAPIIALGHNYPDAPLLGILLMTLFCTLLAPTLHLIRERGGTVFHACLFHGTLNAVATLTNLCIVAPNWKARGILGLPGFVVLAGSAVLAISLRSRSRDAAAKHAVNGR